MSALHGDGTVRPDRIGVVLAGAGARGAYEAGVLSVLLPRLDAAGIRPALYVGTSAGALNAAALASNAHLPPVEQAAALLDVWRQIRVDDVFRPLLWTAPGAVGRWAGQLAGIPGVRLTGLLDTTPLGRTVRERMDWDQLHVNVEEGLVSLAVVTTAVASQRTVVLVDDRSAGTPLPVDDSRPIVYLPGRVGPEHVLASAAIPVLFPAVLLDSPAAAGGWHVDGGVRLNAPLKPALALGADAVVVVATHPADHPAVPDPGTGEHIKPDVDDALVQLMDAALVDRMVEDLRTLGKVNELVRTGRQRRSAGRPYTMVRWLFFGPPERHTLGALAVSCLRRRYRGPAGAWRTIREPDLALLGRFLAGDGPRQGDLLSYLFFDSDFIEAAIERGREDAGEVLAGPDPEVVPWRT
jgi:NTE family protein